VVAGSPAGMLPLMLLVGLFLAPVAIAVSALLDDVVAEGALARAYTMVVAAGLIGVAGGSILAGHLAPRSALILAAALPVAALMWTVARSRTLSPDRRPFAGMPERSGNVG
jgi:MFS family permease